nr:gamma-type small acid-soluble spore protein [Salibacterium halotolerans]
MNNQQQNNASQTDAKKVRRQNAASAQNQSQSQQTEFASETDAQEVRRQNQQSEQKKNQNQQQ